MQVADVKTNHTSDACYIDIYSTDTDVSRTDVNHNITIELYPWRQKTLKTAMQLINPKCETSYKRDLKALKDTHDAHFGAQ